MKMSVIHATATTMTLAKSKINDDKMEIGNWGKGFEKGLERLSPEQRLVFFSECGRNCVHHSIALRVFTPKRDLFAAMSVERETLHSDALPFHLAWRNRLRNENLTNYLLQSVIGCAIFCGYGLACYRYLGVTYAVIVGSGMVVCQYLFARYWFSNHPRGPLEGLWRKLTWINF